MTSAGILVFYVAAIWLAFEQAAWLKKSAWLALPAFFMPFIWNVLLAVAYLVRKA